MDRHLRSCYFESNPLFLQGLIGRKDCCLPEEIIHDILLRVPAEDLIRFKTVCKLWYSFISSRKFIKAHLALTAASAPRQIFFLVSRPGKLSCLCFNLEDLSIPLVEQPLASLEHQLNRSVELLSSCNVLSLMKLRKLHTIVLAVCNPVTRHFTTLPPSQLHFHDGALFYDESTGKAKVLMVSYDALDAVVLTLKGDASSDKWRRVMSIQDLEEEEECFVYLNSRILVLGNKLHCVARADNVSGWGMFDDDAHIVKSYYLWSMDATTEICSKIKIPIRTEILQVEKMFYLSEVEGSIYIVVVLTDLIEIVILEKKDAGQWATYCTINLQSLSSKPACLENLLSKNTCVVATPCGDYENLLYHVKVCVHHEDQIFLCDLKNHDWKQIGIGSKKLLMRRHLLHFSSLVHWD